MSRLDLEGKVALVTGGARGIGAAVGRSLLDRGARVVLVDLDQDAVDQTAATLHDSRALGIAADVSDRHAMQRAVATTVERYGGLDVVVANAGIAPRPATFRAMSPERFDRVVAVNQDGVVHTVRAALEPVILRRGHVVVVSSVAALTNGYGGAPYAMSKAAIAEFGRALRVELASHGASAGVAYFGFIDTDMVRIALDEDPLDPVGALPAVLTKRLTPRQAGEAVVRGIERRAARTITPARWTTAALLRSILNPITDRGLIANRRVQKMVAALDARTGTDQPTSEP